MQTHRKRVVTYHVLHELIHEPNGDPSVPGAAALMVTMLLVGNTIAAHAAGLINFWALF